MEDKEQKQPKQEKRKRETGENRNYMAVDSDSFSFSMTMEQYEDCLKSMKEKQNKVKVAINPIKNYVKYKESNYVLCSITFEIEKNGKIYSFKQECSNKCIEKLIKTIDKYLANKIKKNRSFYFYIPWIMGNCLEYPYSFYININESCWTFRYKDCPNNKDYDFVCELAHSEIISMQEQIKNEYFKIEWEKLGCVNLYTFSTSNKETEWCYSANEFVKELKQVCLNKEIRKIYVSAENYRDPLSVNENSVNYYTGDCVIIQFDDCLLKFGIAAYGLFHWCWYKSSEFTVSNPKYKQIEDGDDEFCDVGNAYGAFKYSYTNSKITDITVKTTDMWPWKASGFDESKLGNPIELPERLHLVLNNGVVVSLIGCDDDFVIEVNSCEKIKQ